MRLKLLITIIGLNVCGTSFAATVRSLSYEMEFGSVNAGGAAAQSGTYSLVGEIVADGVSGQPSGSSSYSISPAFDTGQTVVTRVSDWSLY